MLDGITKSLTDSFKYLSGNAKITETNISNSIGEIRSALVEADVNVDVVKEFINDVTAKAIGEQVVRSVNPREQFIKIVNDGIADILGRKNEPLKLKSKGNLSVILLAGLQGAGKTTTAGKLAKYIKDLDGRKVLLSACDVYRPAAIEQLERVGEMAGVDVFVGDKKDALKISKESFKKAKTGGYDVLIIDTAGRLHVDQEMMHEVKKISKDIRPDEILFVCDSMMGQHAVEIAKEFNDTLEVTGVILTKFDSDTRGGAAFSIKKVINKPIKFIGVSEKIDGLELFHPERIASRILGMGDVVSLVEKAEKIYTEEEALRLEKKMREADFTLQDFLDQLEQMSKLGSMESIMEMIPGMKEKMAGVNVDEKKISRQKAIIQSMTQRERDDHRIIVGTRKRRIANGSGTSVLEVDQLLKNFQKSKQMMKKMAKSKGMFNGLNLGM